MNYFQTKSWFSITCQRTWRCCLEGVKAWSSVSITCPPDRLFKGWGGGGGCSASSTAEVRVPLSERACGGGAGVGRLSVTQVFWQEHSFFCRSLWLSNELAFIPSRSRKPSSYLFVKLGSCCSLSVTLVSLLCLTLQTLVWWRNGLRFTCHLFSRSHFSKTVYFQVSPLITFINVWFKYEMCHFIQYIIHFLVISDHIRTIFKAESLSQGWLVGWLGHTVDFLSIHWGSHPICNQKSTFFFFPPF